MSWNHPLGDAANTCFANVRTQAAGVADARVDGLGGVRPGLGPVIGPDGTVYLANASGLRAFSPTGELRWHGSGSGSMGTSPVVGHDGAVYCVDQVQVVDHRGHGTDYSYVATLHRFEPDGHLAWSTRVPGPTAVDETGASNAAPSIWRWGTTEVVMVPHRQDTDDGQETHVWACAAATGQSLADQPVLTRPWEPLTAEFDWTDLLPSLNGLFGLEPTQLEPGSTELDPDLAWGLPSVAIFSTGESEPIVVVADGDEHLIGYSFSPAAGFTEIFRRHLARGHLSMSAPAVLRDGHSVVLARHDDEAWVLFGGPSAVAWTEVVVPLTGVGAALGTDVAYVVERAGGVTAVSVSPARTLRGRTVLRAQSLAPAALSRTHVFVSTVDALVTLDPETLEVVQEFGWVGGGLSTPAIGADGRVYACAGGTMFCFPGPRRRPGAAAGVVDRPDLQANDGQPLPGPLPHRAPGKRGGGTMDRSAGDLDATAPSSDAPPRHK
jgi:outer membrane protein assembly factor BamB